MVDTFLSYLDDNDKIISGFFEIIEINQAYIKFKTKNNEILLPINRILKIKKEIDR